MTYQLPHASKVYADEMHSLKEGRGLWFPEPHIPTGMAEIGDVGFFMEDGAFHRLFNVRKKEGEDGFTLLDSNLTITADIETFNPKPYLQPRKNALHPKSYPSMSVKSSSHSASGEVQGAAAGLEYRCESKQGAILDFYSPTDTQWLVNNSKVRNFVLQNYDTWQAQIEESLGLDYPLVFVNGYMRTTGDWILTAFRSRGSSFQARVGGQAPGVGGGGFRTEMAEYQEGPVAQRSGRLVTDPHVPERERTTKQDTLFVKYYQVKRLFRFKYLKAGAGPDHIEGDRNPDDNMEGIILESSEDSGNAVDGSVVDKGPLELLLEYILETSGAETAIACLDDLYLLLPTQEWPSDLKAYLETMKPQIDVTDEKVGSVSTIDAIRRKVRRTGREIQMERAAGPLRPESDEEESPGSVAEGQIVLGTGPHSGSPMDWPHLLFKHKDAENGSISCAAVSPDGKLLAVAWDDTMVTLWTLSDCAPSHQLQESGHRDAVWTLVFSPDSTCLVSGSADHNAIVWNVEEGVRERLLQGHQGDVVAVAYSPDGSMVATGSQDTLAKIWNPRNGRLVHTLEGHDSDVTKVAFSPDGKRLASAADSVVFLWDPVSGTKVATMEGHAAGIWSLAFSSNGDRLITASEDHTSRVWDATDGAELVTLHEHADAVLSVAFNPDGSEVVSASHDATIVSCDSFDGTRHHLFDAQQSSPVESVAYSKNGLYIASGYADGNVRVWDAKSGTSLAEYRGHEGKVRSVEFTPNEDILSYADDGTIRFWGFVDTLRLA